MYIEAVPNRNSPPAILLRESYRENGKVRKRTLCNLSDWPAAYIEGLRWMLDPANKAEAVSLLAERLKLPADVAGQAFDATVKGSVRPANQMKAEAIAWKPQ